MDGLTVVEWQQILARVTAGHIALFISFLSFGVAAFSLGWNIYRDVILKPKLRVRFSVSHLVIPGLPCKETYLLVSATNFGPGPVHCKMVCLKNCPLWRMMFRKVEYAVTLHDYQNPMSGRLPAKLEVGESVDVLLPYKQECFLSQRYTHVGINDSFGRVHWASKKNYRNALRTFKKDFKERVDQQSS